MRRLVLLRHGQTAWNAEGRFQGHTDVELDEVGHAQAEAAAAELAPLEPVRLWSSDLLRARTTAEVLGRACGLEIVLDARVREYDVGLRAGLTAGELLEQHPEQHAAWASAGDDTVAGAESHAAVHSRVLEALEEFWSQLGDDDTGIVVMHGAALRTGLAAFLGWPAQTRTTLRGVANCGWVELVEGDHGRPLLAAYNRVACSSVGTG